MKKRIIYILLLFLIIIIFAGCQNKKNTTFVSIAKDDILVEKALSYFKYSINDKKELMTKLFDDNEDLIEEKDLNNTEKMFLVLEEYDRLSDGCIYSQIGRLCSFKKSDIENLVFEKNDFINDYMESRKYYNINGIDLMYNDNIFQVQGQISQDEDNKIAYFYVTDVKKNDELLVIEFVLSYLDFNYTYDKLNTEKVLYYKNINDSEYIDEKEINLPVDDFGSLDKNIFNKYRYTLKIDNNQVFFKSIERI